jgi:hypothetical protein
VRSGFVAFNAFAHVLAAPTQRAFMKVTTPVAPKAGVVNKVSLIPERR